MIKRIIKFIIKLLLVLGLYIASIALIGYGAYKDYEIRQNNIMEFRKNSEV